MDPAQTRINGPNVYHIAVALKEPAWGTVSYDKKGGTAYLHDCFTDTDSTYV